MKTNTLNKVIFFSIILIVIWVSDFLLLSKINNQRDYIAKTKREIITEESKAGSLSDTKRNIAELNKINDRINNVLINESNAVSFISLIEDISSEAGSEIQILSVDFEDSQEEGKLGVIDMKFKVIGAWSEVTDFLNSVESLPYLININSIRFSVVGSGEESRWSVDFRLVGLTN